MTPETNRHPTLLQKSYPKARLIPVPKTLKQAKASKYWPEFERAMQVEVHGLEDHDTFRVIPDKKSYHKLGTKWVYDVKSNPAGDITRFKARLAPQCAQ